MPVTSSDIRLAVRMSRLPGTGIPEGIVAVAAGVCWPEPGE